MSPLNLHSSKHKVTVEVRIRIGYGHRTYKGMDPRVRPIQSILKDLTDVHQPLLKVAEAIEEAAAKDEYFSKRGLYPNADFYGNLLSPVRHNPHDSMSKHRRWNHLWFEPTKSMYWTLRGGRCERRVL
jgi:hypothetical protein